MIENMNNKYSKFNPFPHNDNIKGDLMPLGNKAFENIVGKGENAGYQHFLLFSQCFLLYQRQKHYFLLFNLSSANA